mmetsp:Transcript_7086/g.14485  ORF Transcript_7086/g.14485 Transcript_7086/m.14485 type:complete len:261 (+) Transcript_7086:1356-2138(+)
MFDLCQLHVLSPFPVGREKIQRVESQVPRKVIGGTPSGFRNPVHIDGGRHPQAESPEPRVDLFQTPVQYRGNTIAVVQNRGCIEITGYVPVLELRHRPSDGRQHCQPGVFDFRLPVVEKLFLAAGQSQGVEANVSRQVGLEQDRRAFQKRDRFGHGLAPLCRKPASFQLWFCLQLCLFLAGKSESGDGGSCAVVVRIRNIGQSRYNGRRSWVHSAVVEEARRRRSEKDRGNCHSFGCFHRCVFCRRKCCVTDVCDCDLLM